MAVILVIIFAGVMLRYGFSTSYKGRSNLLRLRYKLNRRGDLMMEDSVSNLLRKVARGRS